VKGRGSEAGRAERGRRAFEADRDAGGEGCEQDTVELLRDMMKDALDRLARSRRRRDPVVALKIACKEACHWFSAGNRKGRG
jgi:hypothetical protein